MAGKKPNDSFVDLDLKCAQEGLEKYVTNVNLLLKQPKHLADHERLNLGDGLQRVIRELEYIKEVRGERTKKAR
jgi:hypothetical protein